MAGIDGKILMTAVHMSAPDDVLVELSGHDNDDSHQLYKR